MESLSLVFSLPPPSQNHLKTHKLAFYKPFSLLSTPLHFTSKPLISFHHSHVSCTKVFPLQFTISNSLQNHPSLLRNSSLFPNITKSRIRSALIQLFLTPLPCFASEVEQAPGKLNLESILVAIDDFFNKYPFFVAGCTFIWLVVLPITEEYFRKYKFITAIDAFRRLRDNPNVQLLDIRDEKSLTRLKSPNLKILNKGAVQVQYSEEDEDGFVKKVLENFEDDANTVVCILDNFDGNSMKVAELLFKNGFKEAYAIKGGVRGKKGWLAIQETLLPPSVCMYGKKKVKTSQKLGLNGVVRQGGDDNESTSSPNAHIGESQSLAHENLNKPVESTSRMRTHSGSLSPYPNYPDLKPPSSPTPSKPGS